MTGSVKGIRRRRTVAGRRETPHLPPDRDFYGQTLLKVAERIYVGTIKKGGTLDTLLSSSRGR